MPFALEYFVETGNMKSLVALTIFVTLVSSFPSKEAGIRQFSIENRIAGGDLAEEGQFPFQVGVQTHYRTEEDEEYTAWCGGSLISDRVVLTAAHCVHDGISTEIFLGAADLGNHPLIINVPKEGMIQHENYHSGSVVNDIAVVILPQKVQLNDKIQTVNLPRKSQRNMSFEKTVGWISGWGRMGDQKGSTEKLQYTRRWILPDDYCEYHFGSSFRKDTQICVDGSHGISACKGDSGGPLTIIEEDGTRTLLGATSYGKFVCEKDFPVVYTRVTAYLDWIAEKGGITLRD